MFTKSEMEEYIGIYILNGFFGRVLDRKLYPYINDLAPKVADMILYRAINRYEIINKCDMLHRLVVNDGEKQDYVLMCIELLLAVLKHINFKLENAVFDRKAPFYIKDVSIKQGLDYLNSVYANANQTTSQYYNAEQIHTQRVEYIRTEDIYGVILASYRRMLGFTKDRWVYGKYDNNEIMNHTKEFWELLQVIS